MNNDELLKYALEHGMIDMSYVQEQVQMNKRKELLEKYGKGIWQGKNGKWYVKLPDRKQGKVLRKRNSQKLIEDLVVEFYQNYREAIYFPDVYKEWIAEKEEYCEVEESSITRYNNDFKRFFSFSEPFCKIEIQDIDSSALEQFIKRMIRDKELSVKSYAGLRTLLLGVLKHAKREGYTDFSVSNFFFRIWCRFFPYIRFLVSPVNCILGTYIPLSASFLLGMFFRIFYKFLIAFSAPSGCNKK